MKSVADPGQAFGMGSQIGRRQKGLHLSKYQRFSATIVECHTSGNGNGLLFHMTQPTSRSTIKAFF